jgi:cytochrome P450
LGAEANRFVFAHDELFSVREAFAALVPVDGETSLVVSDGADHRRRRRLVQPAMHQRQVQGYVATMAEQADLVVGSWSEGQPVDAYRELRGAIRRSTIASLFGPGLARHAEDLATDLQPLLDLVDRLPDAVAAHRRLRSPLWRRAMAARERVDAWIHAEIDRARRAPTEQDHVLGLLVHGRDGEGSGLTDQEIRDQVVTLVAAGYETTSAAMGWTLYALGGHPRALRRAGAEVAEVIGDRVPTAEDLRSLGYLRAVVSETLRLYPPAVVSARHAVTDFEFAGRRVPAGTTVIYSPYVTHRSAQVYADPLAFRPERWLGEGGELRRVPPHEYLPFGGGAHRCIASTMATTELCVMLCRVLARGGFQVPPQRVSPVGFAAMRPRHGLRVIPTPGP